MKELGLFVACWAIVYTLFVTHRDERKKKHFQQNLNLENLRDPDFES